MNQSTKDLVAKGKDQARRGQRMAAEGARTVASWWDRHEPEVRAFAQRRPGVLVAVAVIVGFLAGRLTKRTAEPTSDTAAGPEPMAAVRTEQAPIDPATPGYVMPPSGTVTPPGSVTR
jgi:hypothetical protein